LPGKHYECLCLKEKAIDSELARLDNVRCGPETLAQILRRPEVTHKDLPQPSCNLPREVIEQVQILVKYAGYLDRQENEVNKLKSLEHKNIPTDFDYTQVPSLRKEARQKLASIRPATLGQAGRISGVSPADLSILLVWLKRSASTQLQPEPKASESAEVGTCQISSDDAELEQH
jgi:tRNA uridine 5-carboxymethylaminomethyl modification enzyme